MASLDVLEGRLGHRFRDTALLEIALTHRSALRPGLAANERLEFLGDRVLSLAVAHFLYRRFPTENEGDLSRRLASLVRREALARVARALELGADLRLSRGEEASGGRENPGLLADACEALLGAVYLDGGIEAAEGVVARLWAPLVEDQAMPSKDARTALQELVQARGLPLPRYTVARTEGPDHAPRFVMSVAIEGEASAEAEGASKQAASEAAARLLLVRMGVDV